MATIIGAQKQDWVVFSCQGAEYTVREVVDAAHFRGEVESLWRRHLQQAAAQTLAADTGAEVEGSAIDEAAIAFRYEYDLITAEETEAWLELRGLTLADFGDYFARQYWGKTLGARAKPAEDSFSAASPEQRDPFVATLIFAGEIDRAATRLAWRVAAKAAAQERPDAAAIEAERARFAVPFNPAALGRDPAWLEEMFELEAIFRAVAAKYLTPETRQREITALRLPLTRLEIETIEFDTRDAAREALFCVRDDGMAMEEVAREGRYPFRRREMVLEEIPEDQQQKFLSVTAGTLLEPVPRDDGFILSRLIAKHEPNPADPPVRARLEQRIMQRHFGDLMSGRVHWRVLSNVSA